MQKKFQLYLPMCFPFTNTLGTVFCPDKSSKAFCMSEPIGPMVSNSTAVKSILFCLKVDFNFKQNGHVVLENTMTLLSLMCWATRALGSSPFTIGGIVLVERLQPIVEIKLCLKLKIETGDCCVSERQLERTLMQFLLCFKVVKTQRISINWKIFRICSLIHWKKIFLLQKSVTYKQTAYFLHFFATFWKQMKSPLTFDRAVATTMVKRIGRGQNLKWIKRHARIRSWKIPSQARQCRSTSTKDQHDSLHQFLYMFFFYFSASTS